MYMNTKYSRRKLLVFVLYTLSAAALLIGAGVMFYELGTNYRDNNFNALHSRQLPLAKQSPTQTFHQIIALIDQLPDSALKSNLYVVVGIEYAERGDELNAILLEYARMIQQEMKKKNTL